MNGYNKTGKMDNVKTECASFFDRMSACFFCAAAAAAALSVVADSAVFNADYQWKFLILSGVLIVAAGVVYAARLLASGCRPLRTAPHKRGLVYLACILAPGVACSNDPRKSVLIAMAIMSAFFSHYAFKEAFSSRESGLLSPRAAGRILAAAGVFAVAGRVLALGCCGHIEAGGFFLGPSGLPAEGAFSFDQLFAFFMAVCFPFPAAAALFSGRGPGRAFSALCACVIGGAMLLTFSRAGWAALAAEAVVLAMFSGRRRAALAVAAALAAILLFAPGVAARAATIFDPAHATNMQRLDQWRAALLLSSDSPFCGCGLGTFGGFYGRLAGAGMRPVAWPHNLFLHLAVECGLLAPAFFFAWLFEFRKPASPPLGAGDGTEAEQMAALHLAAAALLAGIMAFGLFDL